MSKFQVPSSNGVGCGDGAYTHTHIHTHIATNQTVREVDQKVPEREWFVGSAIW